MEKNMFNWKNTLIPGIMVLAISGCKEAEAVKDEPYRIPVPEYVKQANSQLSKNYAKELELSCKPVEMNQTWMLSCTDYDGEYTTTSLFEVISVPEKNNNDAKEYCINPMNGGAAIQTDLKPDLFASINKCDQPVPDEFDFKPVYEEIKRAWFNKTKS
jgi:hypothetical protein